MTVLDNLAHSKVCQTKVTLVINQDIFWLEVPVEDTLAVHVLKGKYDLCGVELGPGLLKAIPVILVQVVEKFSSVDKFHHHVKVVLILKSILKAHNERVVEHRQDVTLGCRIERHFNQTRIVW